MINYYSIIKIFFNYYKNNFKKYKQKYGHEKAPFIPYIHF